MAAVPPAARTNGVHRPNGTARPNGVPRANGVPAANKPRATPSRPQAPRAPKAASVSGGESQVNGVTSAYAIMANRIANRVAEMAESITFVERYVTLTWNEIHQAQDADIGALDQRRRCLLTMSQWRRSGHASSK